MTVCRNLQLSLSHTLARGAAMTVCRNLQLSLSLSGHFLSPTWLDQGDTRSDASLTGTPCCFPITVALPMGLKSFSGHHSTG
jgi:hypothetical protein